ncbi:biotin transporter BioY [Companilactobacillus nuruki]|uniref:Biotin transporter n=1 Tax=Companilactobacillus nuruki TaxID=1993540 RepID=A0A2N7AWQ0_9LACO|nr:biotin transporter BioY [Companilactobacillus nuruki]PMD73174.1 biotin transporter BioY [Companilactobacillus nuruki]
MAAVMTAILIVLGLFPPIPLGLIPVPIVLQNIGVMISGELLGPKYGTISIIIFYLLIILGMPVLSGSRGGIIVFLGPTCGYLISWLLTPIFIGYFVKYLNKKNKNSWWKEFLIVCLFGILSTYFIGSLVLAYQSHTSFITIFISNLFFVPTDLIKAALSTFIARRLRQHTHMFII